MQELLAEGAGVRRVAGEHGQSALQASHRLAGHEGGQARGHDEQARAASAQGEGGEVREHGGPVAAGQGSAASAFD
eukprot:2975197-Pyramimonas_sp.AAC.1